MQGFYSLTVEGRRVAEAIVAIDREYGTDNLSIVYIEVKPDFRGIGFGSKLLKEILRDADKELQFMVLYVSAGNGLSNPDLYEWYGRHGFVRHPKLYGFMTRLPQPKRIENESSSDHKQKMG